MTTENREYTEVPGSAAPDVPYWVNTALGEIDADVQGVANSVTEARTYADAQDAAYRVTDRALWRSEDDAHEAAAIAAAKTYTDAQDAAYRTADRALWRSEDDSHEAAAVAAAETFTLSREGVLRSFIRAEDDAHLAVAYTHVATREGAIRATLESGQTEQDGRLSLLESAAGFDAPPLGFEDSIIEALVANPESGTTKAVAAQFTRKGELMVNPRDYGAKGTGTDDDTEAIQEAAAAAFAAGALMLWPSGDYLTTASIPNLHNVRHTGRGRIFRGVNIFYPSPTNANANILYVATDGSPTNDGLSPTTPINLLSKTLGYLSNYGTWLQGDWSIRLAAGTYNDSAITGQKSVKRIWIYGPEVPVGATPTAIFDPGSTSFAKAIGGNDYLNIGIRDIKVQNYKVPEVPAIDFSTHCTIGLINVHSVFNDIGFRFMSHTTYSAAGIVAANNVQYGISELFSVVRNFRDGGAENPSYIYGNGKHGIKSKELCTGHLDYARIYDNKHGVHFSRSCTANATLAQIYRNQYGVTLRNNSSFVPLNTDWKFGTADANTVVPWDVDGTSSFVNSENEAAVSGLFTGRGERQLGYFCPPVPFQHTGTTAATTVASFGNLLRGSLARAGGYVRTVVIGSRAGTGGTISLEFRFGGSGAGIVTIPTTTAVFRIEYTIYSLGPGKQSVYISSDIPGTNGILTRTYDVAASDVLLSLRSTLTSAADSINIVGAWCHTTEALASEG